MFLKLVSYTYYKNYYLHINVKIFEKIIEIKVYDKKLNQVWNKLKKTE